MSHILAKVQGQIKEVCRLKEPCLLIGTREYLNGRDLKDSFMILSDFSFIFLLRNFIYDMSPSAEKEIKITPYGGGIEGKHSP